ncbi:hypothetical protein PACTADRAFT_184910 [Pachysolen tannophilus NRRL Y-2460]|uniref:Uracil permease n=1 Tax=Pachysolen tannophilus NRRL Y-2460 TaxID=669874 RepID=A0A1E4U3E2_PACTA|nr:hypothetical protein PACTADRAFT_184910 [Pachysolen tannophilus NRRL Y-2460]
MDADIITTEQKNKATFEVNVLEEAKNGDIEDYENSLGSYSGNSTNIKRRGKFSTAIKSVIGKIELEKKGDLSVKELFLYNADLKPVESERRTWKWYNFVFFWVADSFNINTWQIAATGVEAGLPWWAVWITVWLGYGIVGVFIVVSSKVGSYYHVSFPVSCRASFGVFGSIWPIINRVVMAIVWYGVQSWIGGQCVQIMLEAIFGNDLNTRIPDGIASPNATTFQFLGFFLFWLFSLPAIWFPPQTIRHLFTVKACIVPIAGIAFLIWTIKKADGIGSVIHEKSTLTGSAFGWAFVKSTMNALANFCTLIVNAPDFSRFANKPAAAVWSQLIFIPLCFSLTGLIGILVSSSSSLLTSDGSVLWSPLDVLALFLDNFTSGNRAGVFFIAFAFALAQLGTNISANSLSAGTDMTALLPRYINIRRGGYICAALALCICPWNLDSSSSNFTTYLSAYAVFLSAISGVVTADYYVVRRGYLNIFDLYSGEKNGIYRYNTIGCNWRAYLSYICGIAPNITGFVGDTGAHTVPGGAMYPYYLSYFCGYFASFFVYCILCWIWPIKGTPVSTFFEKGWYEEYAEVDDFDEIKLKQVIENGMGDITTKLD